MSKTLCALSIALLLMTMRISAHCRQPGLVRGAKIVPLQFPLQRRRQETLKCAWYQRNYSMFSQRKYLS